MITNKEEYTLALKEFMELMDAKRGTDEGLRFEELGDMIQAYEDAHFPSHAAMSVEEYRKRDEEYDT